MRPAREFDPTPDPRAEGSETDLGDGVPERGDLGGHAQGRRIRGMEMGPERRRGQLRAKYARAASPALQASNEPPIASENGCGGHAIGIYEIGVTHRTCYPKAVRA